MKITHGICRAAGIFSGALLLMGSAVQLGAVPDPEIFDGSGYGEESTKRYSIQKVLDMIKVNAPIPKMPRSGGKQSGQQGPSAQKSGTGQGGLGQEQGAGTGRQGDPNEVGMGSKQEEIDPNAHGEAIGGELSEVDQKALEAAQNASNQSSRSQQSRQGQQGQQGRQGEMKGMAGMQGANSVTLGSKEEMIDVAQQAGSQEGIDEGADEGAVGSDEMLDSKGPEMRGKNKGRSVGVETGQSIPTDL